MTNLRVVTLIALAACGHKKDAPATASGSGASATAVATASSSAAPAGTPVGKCSFTVTGAISQTVEGIASAPRPNSAAMAATDYWMTDAEIRSGIEMMVGLDRKKSKDEIAAKVEAGMKSDPRIMLLAINCGGDLGAIDLGPGSASKYADIPMKPGKYVIADRAKAGQFNALINMRDSHHSFSISEPGTLDITKFDLTGIAGTFAFKATSFDGKEAIEVKGSFDYPCVGQACTK